MAEIEILTNRDRAALNSGLCEGGRKALRIIDAHASDRAALVEQARAELECSRRERDTWRSLCETAERSRDDAAARADAAEELARRDGISPVQAEALSWRLDAERRVLQACTDAGKENLEFIAKAGSGPVVAIARATLELLDARRKETKNAP